MIALLLFVLAGFFNACMDTLQFKLDNSLFKRCKNQQWMDPKLSSSNKWKYIDGIWTGEKFFGSSTFLVFLTDMWHMCKFLMILSLVAGAAFYSPMLSWWADIFILYLGFTVSFELFYSRALVDR